MGDGYLKKIDYPQSLDSLIVSLCADYERRNSLLSDDRITRRTRMEFIYLNGRICEAVAEIASPRLCGIYINEIGRRVGYASSAVDCLSEVAYKKEKREIKLNIARKLHLAD